MRKLTGKGVMCLALIGSLTTLKAQTLDRSVIASAGGHADAAGFSVSWTLGEPVTETVTNSGMTLTQGFHQSDKVTITTIKEPLADHFTINVFPNPASEFLNIAVAGDRDETLTYQLFALNGEKIYSEKSKEKNVRIKIADLSSANYLLSIRKLNGELVKSFVINKSK